MAQPAQLALPISLTPGTVVVLVGTKRGLFWSPRQTARLGGPSDDLEAVRVFNASSISGRAVALRAENGDFFGNFIKFSDDFGATWESPERGIEFPEGGT